MLVGDAGAPFGLGVRCEFGDGGLQVENRVEKLESESLKSSFVATILAKVHDSTPDHSADRARAIMA